MRNTSVHAINIEFCALFATEMKGFYLLSLLLTADEAKAEKCFVSSLEGCIEGNSVFKEWAHSWAKRVIVKNGIQMIAPSICHSRDIVPAPPDVCGCFRGTQQAHRAMVRIFTLRDFERIVFVLSVLERYSDRECAHFLGCSQREICEGRAKAFWQIGDYDTASPPSVEDTRR